MSTKVTILEHGPIKLEGAFELLDAENRPFSGSRKHAIYLCRCGRSTNKPLCDGSHGASGFRDAAMAREISS